MLRWRMVTALCLIPLVLLAVLKLTALPFAILSGVFFALGVWEWAGLCGLSKSWVKRFYVADFFVLIVILSIFHNLNLLFVGSLLWLCPLFLVYTYKQQVPLLLKNDVVKALIGLILSALAWISLNRLHAIPDGPQWIILLFVLIWSSDTFAYFVGRKWGNVKLAPLISPKKTVEGFLGGLLGTMLVALMLFYAVSPFMHLPPLYVWLSVAFIVILLGVVGDLFESLLKRLAGVKDSGTLLPGHGGILDRIDSLLAALPFYALSLLWLLGEK